jgi:hypothetical protein
MERSFFTRLTIAVLILTSLCMFGCGTLKSFIPGASHTSKSMLKKKVLVAPVINMSEQLNDEKAAQLTETWLNLLKKDDSLLVTLLTGFKSSQSTVTSSEQGVVVDPALIKKAGEMGMNILVTQVLEPLNYTAKKRGIWPFRKLKGEYDVSMITNAVDIVNGTLILSSRDLETIKMGPVPEGQKTPPSFSKENLNKVLDDLLKSQSSSLLDALAGQEWKGKIVLEGGKIRINGGADIGITKGSVFEVFAKGEQVKSATGKEYYVQGMKAGEISVTDIMEDYSFAAPLDNKVFENGLIIALKSK